MPNSVVLLRALFAGQFFRPLFAGLNPLPLGVIVSLGTCCISPSATLSQVNVAVEPSNLAKDVMAKSSPFRGVPFSADRVRSMVSDLRRLEEHYELTLAAAGVLYQSEESMVELLAKLTPDQPSSDTLQVPARYAGTVRALNQAKQYRQDFQSLIQEQNYLQASKIWLKAKNLLVDHFPTGHMEASPQIRAIWIDRGTIVKAKSAKDLARLFDRLQRAGINVVFFETVNAGYPIYPSDVAPQQNPLIWGWDPLKEAIALAHDRDMELHAWVWAFATANQRHNQILGLPKNYPGPVLGQHPDWAITDRRGNRPEWISGKSFMDPANPDVRDYLHRLLSEIVTRYDVDGLQLDYIRYPFQNPGRGNVHGYSAESRRQFQKQYRVDPIQVGPRHPYWNHWVEFKAQKIDSFVQETAERLKAKKPDLIVSAAVFPMATPIRHQTLQQNWQRWVKAGWVDLLAPMTYATNTKALQTMTDPLFEPEFQGAALTIPGLRLLNMPSYKTLEQVHYVQRSPTAGYSLFAAAHFRSSLVSTLNRPALKSKPLLPHRAPLASAHTVYSGLQREWQYWLERRASQISPTLDQLDSWAKATDQMSEYLSQLQAEPEAEILEVAQAHIEDLQTLSKAWMTDSDLVLPEQIQHWEHRLQRIQRLLAYAEKQVDAADLSVVASQPGE